MMSRSEEPNQEELFQEAAAWIASVEASKLSGGPKTDAGKRISSRNSRKHGLMSKDIETRFDNGLDIPDWLFALADQLRAIAEEDNPTDAHLIRKALIAAWRAELAQAAIATELTTAPYLPSPFDAAEAAAEGTGSSDDPRDLSCRTASQKTKKLSYYAARFRAERDNAIWRLRRHKEILLHKK